MSSRVLRIVVLTYMLVFISTIAYACSAYMSGATIDCKVKDAFLQEHACLDENCTYTTSFVDGKGTVDGYSFGFTPDSIWYWRFMEYGTIDDNDKNAAILFLEKACKEDTSGIRKYLEDGGAVTRASPYSTALIKDLQAGKDNMVYDQCKYTDFKVINGWILQQSATRSYCDEWFGPDCGGVAPNPEKYAAQTGKTPPASAMNQPRGPMGGTDVVTPDTLLPDWVTVLAVIAAIVVVISTIIHRPIHRVFQFDRAKRNILATFTAIYFAIYFAHLGAVSFFIFAISLVTAYPVLSIGLAIHRNLAIRLFAKRAKHPTAFREFIYPILYGITCTCLFALLAYILVGRPDMAGIISIAIPLGTFIVLNNFIGFLLAIPITIVVVGAIYFIIGRIALAIRTGIRQFKLDFIGNPEEKKTKR